MKFLKTYDIEISKFNIKDLILTKDFVILIGKYKNDGTRLPPLPPKKVFVNKIQLAQYGNYIYIPEDQLNQVHNLINYKFPDPVNTDIKPKYYWLNLKTNYPYEGK